MSETVMRETATGHDTTGASRMGAVMHRGANVLVAAAVAWGLVGCSNADMARQRLKEESENSYGVMRTVTVFSQTGEQIAEYHGKIDVEYGDASGMGKVDLVFFDGDDPVDRIVITGDAVVIVDNDFLPKGADAEDDATEDADEDETETDGDE